VFPPLPDEPRGEEPVALVPWHDVDVKVRNALADPGVRRDERSRGTEGLLHSDRSPADRAEDGHEQRIGEVIEGLDVRRGHHKHMTEHQGRAVAGSTSRKLLKSSPKLGSYTFATNSFA